MKRCLNSVLDSPKLLLALMGLTLFLLLGWRHYQAKTEAPEISDYSWNRHTNTLLLCYLPDCGCGVSASQWSNEGIARDMDILIVSDKPAEKEVLDLQKLYPKRNIAVRQISKALVKQLAPFGKTTATFVNHGKIVRQISGAFDFKKFAL